MNAATVKNPRSESFYPEGNHVLHLYLERLQDWGETRLGGDQSEGGG